MAGTLKKLGVGGQASSGGCVAEQPTRLLNKHPGQDRQRRPVPPEVWAALDSAIAKQIRALPSEHPRRKPTLPDVSWGRK
jgi:hypothetical protein